jgi:hypothetical protein
VADSQMVEINLFRISQESTAESYLMSEKVDPTIALRISILMKEEMILGM